MINLLLKNNRDPRSGKANLATKLHIKIFLHKIIHAKIKSLKKQDKQAEITINIQAKSKYTHQNKSKQILNYNLYLQRTYQV